MFGGEDEEWAGGDEAGEVGEVEVVEDVGEVMGGGVGSGGEG